MPYYNFIKNIGRFTVLFFDSEKPISTDIQTNRDSPDRIRGRLIDTADIFADPLSAYSRQPFNIGRKQLTLDHYFFQPSRKGEIHFLMSGDM